MWRRGPSSTTGRGGAEVRITGPIRAAVDGGHGGCGFRHGATASRDRSVRPYVSTGQAPFDEGNAHADVGQDARHVASCAVAAGRSSVVNALRIVCAVAWMRWSD